MAKKVTEDIARLRGIPAGIDLRSPSRHPGRARRRRPRDQGRGVPRGDRLDEAGVGEARRRTRPRRHQDRLQGRLRLRLPRRPAGLDRRRRQRGARVRRHPDAVGDHGGARRARRDRGDRVCRSCSWAASRTASTPPRRSRSARTASPWERARSSPAAASPACSATSASASSASQPRIPSTRSATTSTSRRWNIHRYLESVRWQLASVVHAHGYCVGVRALPRRPGRAHAGGRRDHAPPVRAGATSATHGRAASAMPDDRRRASPSRRSPTSTASERVVDPPVPAELASRDDVLDAHFVPAPCQVACPIGTDAPVVHRLHLGGKDRGGVRGDHGDEPVLLGVRPGVRRALRAGLPPRRLRRADRDPQPEALRDGQARARATDLPPVPVTRTQTVGIVGGGPAGLTAAQDLAEAGYAVHVYEMTDDARRLHDLGHPGVPVPARGLRGGHRPHARTLPRDHGPPEHGARRRRDARRARRSGTTPCC